MCKEILRAALRWCSSCPTARAYGSITASRRTRTEILRAALRWCSSRPRLARMGPLRHHGAPAQQHRGPCRTGPALRSVMLLFTKTSPAHKRVVSLVRTYISYVYIRDCTRTERSWTTACVHFFARSLTADVGWRSPVISSLAACVSVTLCGVPVQRGADPFGRRSVRFPPLLVPSPLSASSAAPRAPAPAGFMCEPPRPRAAPVLNYPP